MAAVFAGSWARSRGGLLPVETTLGVGNSSRCGVQGRGGGRAVLAARDDGLRQPSSQHKETKRPVVESPYFTLGVI